jgi:hypothetical protein
LGVLYGRKGKLAEALDKFERAVRVNPDHAGVHENLKRAGRDGEDEGEKAESVPRAVGSGADSEAASKRIARNITFQRLKKRGSLREAPPLNEINSRSVLRI